MSYEINLLLYCILLQLSQTSEAEISDTATPPSKPRLSFLNILRKTPSAPQPVKPQEKEIVNLETDDENSTESEHIRLELQSDSPSPVVLSEDDEIQPDQVENDTINQLNFLTEKIEAQLSRSKNTVRRKDMDIVHKKISTSPQKIATRPQVKLLLTKNLSQASRNSENVVAENNTETSQSSIKKPTRIVRILLPNSIKSQLIKKSLPVPSSSMQAKETSSTFNTVVKNKPKILTLNTPNKQKPVFTYNKNDPERREIIYNKKGIVTIKSSVQTVNNSEVQPEKRYFESVSQFADTPADDDDASQDGSYMHDDYIQIEELNDFQFNPRRRDIEILPVDLQEEGMEQFVVEDDDTKGSQLDSRPGKETEGLLRAPPLPSFSHTPLNSMGN